MNPKPSRVVIVGGGMVGLTLAALLQPFVEDITVLENQPAALEPQTTPDPRVSAIHHCAQALLEKTGVWKNIPAAAVGIVQHMQVIDAKTSAEIHFDFEMTASDRLASIVENRVFTKTLFEYLKLFSNIKILQGVAPQKLEFFEQGARLFTVDGSALEAELIIGADGGNSWLRTQMNIVVDQKSYGQYALIALVKTEKPHENKAIQIFLKNGPLALLPLAEAQTSALIWTLPTQDATDFAKLDANVLAAHIGIASQKIFGKVELVSKVKTIPLIARDAEHYVKPHAVLVGDAAHTIHPLAGQGVNLGLMDAQCLSEHLLAAVNKGVNIGTMRYLRAYERERAHQNRRMMRLMTVLQMLFTSQLPGAATARRLGLGLLNHSDFLKQWMIQYATGG